LSFSIVIAKKEVSFLRWAGLFILKEICLRGFEFPFSSDNSLKGLNTISMFFVLFSVFLFSFSIGRIQKSTGAKHTLKNLTM